MNIINMTRKEFIALPRLEHFKYFDADSVVLIPTRRKDSGWGLFDCVVCNGDKPLGRVGVYDVFNIWTNNKSERVAIDLLEKSGLFRIFLQHDEYRANVGLHEIRSKFYEFVDK